MSEPVNLASMSDEEIKKMLSESGKSTILCHVPWERITFIQARVKTDSALIAEYQDVLSKNNRMPPSKGIYVPELKTIFIYDGIHTAEAHHNLDKSSIPVQLKAGSKIEAEIEASGANSAHGAKRTNSDKRCAVKLLLKNPELCARSNNWLSETAKVSPQLVEDVRRELEKDSDNPVPRPKKRRVVRSCVEYEIDLPQPSEQPALEKVGAQPTPEEMAKRLVASLEKRLKTLSEAERVNIFLQLIGVIKNKFLLQDKAS